MIREMEKIQFYTTEKYELILLLVRADFDPCFQYLCGSLALTRQVLILWTNSPHKA